MAFSHVLVGLLVCLSTIDAADQQDSAAALANPIRKVVNMLQALQTKVIAEGAKEKALYDKFACYCQNGAGELSKSVSEAEVKVTAVNSDISEGEAKKKQLEEDLKTHQADRAAGKAAMSTAEALRKKAAATFAKEKASTTSNIDALSRAIAAISKGMSGTFLQTDAARVLKMVVSKATLLDADRQDIMAFLSGGQDGQYVPQSAEIVGVLRRIKDEMSKGFAEAEAAELASIASHDQLMAAKSRELGANTNAIETKSIRLGQLAVEISQMKNDLSDTKQGLVEDGRFLSDLDNNCAAQAKEWDERQKTRSEELLAIAETIKALNDDGALELFKKTLPGSGSSFVQMSSSQSITRSRALSMIRVAKEKSNHRPQFDFISLALKGKAVGFEKVIKMIDGMIATLKKEQHDEDHKKDYCSKQFEFTGDKRRGLAKTISDLEISIQDSTEGVATLTEEIESLESKIQDLDKSVTEATEQRKAEHQDFIELMASSSEAKELLKFATNRLNQFYHSKRSQGAPNPALSQEGVTALVEVSEHLHHQAAPPPPPATFDAYSKDGGDDVIEMIKKLAKSLDKAMREAQDEEKDTQREYEQMLKDSADKRALDGKSLTDKNVAKASMETDLEASKEAKMSAGTELMATDKLISSLHAECDFLLQYFDVRKEARSSEMEALENAKGVLNGLDISLLQRQSGNLRKR